MITIDGVEMDDGVDEPDWKCAEDEHQYREIETAPLGVVCIHCGHFVGAWET